MSRSKIKFQLLIAGINGIFLVSPSLMAQSLSAADSIIETTNEEQLRQAVENHPNEATSHFRLADFLWEKNNLDGAIESYWNAIACDPTLGSAYINLGQIYKQRNQYALAESSYEAAATLMPDSPIPQLVLGHIAFETRRFRIAIRDLNRCIELAGDVPIPLEISVAYACMTECYIQLSDYSTALATLERYVKHRGLPENDTWIFTPEETGFAGKLFELYMRLGQRYLQDKNTPDCAICYKRGLQIQPRISDFN